MPGNESSLLTNMQTCEKIINSPFSFKKRARLTKMKFFQIGMDPRNLTNSWNILARKSSLLTIKGKFIFCSFPPKLCKWHHNISVTKFLVKNSDVSYSVRRSFKNIENLGDRNIHRSPTSLTCHQHIFVSNIRYQDRSSPRPVMDYEPTIPFNLFLIELIIKIKLCLKIKKERWVL